MTDNRTHVTGSTLHISINDEDILNGVRGNASQCAVARAIKRWLPDALVDVDVDVIAIEENGVTEWLAPDARLSKFIEAFDREEPVASGQYDAFHDGGE